ncbi:hypothetical protein [Pseudomonas lactis]|uniref:hypothetical protein n=1 Tax=Pseudomonas lactis TaxID=1615674 RepID=UPI00110C859D|nr:hypothetical protein [Pseudomonas lactis]MBK3440643.1 hypothetical protein [Pseudomonas lactis]
MTDGIFLIFSVVLAVFVSLILVACLVGDGPLSNFRITSILKLDTSKGLIHQGLLWMSIFTPLAVAIALGLWVWPKYSFELSPAGFKNFIDISILPLAVMSLSLPLSGLISRFHSTQQTAKQIEVVSFKNNLDAFYTHRKEMLAYFSAMQDVDYLGVEIFKYHLHPVLHVRFFSGAPEDGLPKIEVDSFESVNAQIMSGAKFLKSVLVPSGIGSFSTLDAYLQACKSICLAANSLHITQVTRGIVSRGVLVRSEGCAPPQYDFITLGTSTLDVLAAIRFTKDFYDNLCDFAGYPRSVIPENLEIVFQGGQSILDGDLEIERLHESEIAHLIEIRRASYDENHPLSLQATPVFGETING